MQAQVPVAGSTATDNTRINVMRVRLTANAPRYRKHTARLHGTAACQSTRSATMGRWSEPTAAPAAEVLDRHSRVHQSVIDLNAGRGA